MTHDPQPPGMQAALEALAAALDPRDYITTLTTGEHRAPRLTVTSRHAQFGDDIYADSSSYWWSWAERIATVDDPVAAARKITSVLRAATGPPLADQRPAPGLDQIAVAIPPGRCLCNSREHAQLGCL